MREFLIWRGVQDPCGRCSGSGTTWYGSTSTWRGGIGGASMTRDVCDQCWGTGDKHRTGEDLRKLHATMKAEIAKAAVTLLTEAVGARMSVTRDAVVELIGELDRLSRGRKQRPPFFYDICRSLSKRLQLAIEAKP